MELGQGMEAADHSSRRLKGQKQHIKNVIGTPGKPKNSPQLCYRCEKSNHIPEESRFKDSSCNACGKKGHIAPACPSNPQRKYNSPENSKKSKKKYNGTHQVHQQSQGNADSEKVRAYTLSETVSPCPLIQVTLQDARKPLSMEVDTGATVSTISEATKKKYFPEIKLQTCKLVLKTYTNEPMPVLGQLHVDVCYQGQSVQFILYVVPGNGPTPMGRNWLKHICLDWH